MLHHHRLPTHPPPLSILSCCTNCLQYIPSSALYVSSRSTAKSTTSSPSWICLALLRTLFAFSSLRLCFAMISAWAFSLFLSDADSFPSNYKNSPIKYTLVMSILKSAQNEVFLMTRASVSYWSMQEMKKKNNRKKSESECFYFPWMGWHHSDPGSLSLASLVVEERRDGRQRK